MVENPERFRKAGEKGNWLHYFLSLFSLCFIGWYRGLHIALAYRGYWC